MFDPQKETLKAISFFLVLIALAEGLYIYKNQHRASAPVTTQSSFPGFPTFHFNFGTSSDPFADMNRQFGSLFQNLQNSMPTQQFSFGAPQRVDQGNEVHLIFDMAGHKKANCQVKIENGMMVMAFEEKDHGSSNSSNYWHQTVEIPVPDGVDPQSLRIEHGKDKVVLIFKKAKNGNTNGSGNSISI